MCKTHVIALNSKLSGLLQATHIRCVLDTKTQQLLSMSPTQKPSENCHHSNRPKILDLTLAALEAFADAQWDTVNQWLFAQLPYLRGTPFQTAVWRAIAQIPPGVILSYLDLAKIVGRPRAVRAVGTACGANPFPFLIPCHRVVAKNGIGGYGYDLELKKRLLLREKALCS